MKPTEIKARVEFRMKPLMIKGVRCTWQTSEFEIREYEWYDSSQNFIIYLSDRVDPVEFNVDQMILFLNEIKRKDRLPVPGFWDDATHLEQHVSRKYQKKTQDKTAE